MITTDSLSPELAELKTASRFVAYLSADSRSVTTWHGERVGQVTRMRVAGRRMTNDGPVSRVFVRVTDIYGARWSGIGPNESGTYVSLRRLKSSR